MFDYKVDVCRFCTFYSLVIEWIPHTLIDLIRKSKAKAVSICDNHTII